MTVIDGLSLMAAISKSWASGSWPQAATLAVRQDPNGEWWKQEMENVGSSNPEDLGLMCTRKYARAGIYVWEGRCEIFASALGYPSLDESEYSGEWRLASTQELEALQRGEIEQLGWTQV